MIQQLGALTTLTKDPDSNFSTYIQSTTPDSVTFSGLHKYHMNAGKHPYT